MWDLSALVPLEGNSSYPKIVIQDILDEAPLNVLVSPR